MVMTTMCIQLNGFNTTNDDDSQGCIKVKFENTYFFNLKQKLPFVLKNCQFFWGGKKTDFTENASEMLE